MEAVCECGAWGASEAGQGEGSRPSGMEQLQEDMELEEDEQRLEEKLEQIRLSHPGQERVSRKCQVLER